MQCLIVSQSVLQNHQSAFPIGICTGRFCTAVMRVLSNRVFHDYKVPCHCGRLVLLLRCSFAHLLVHCLETTGTEATPWAVTPGARSGVFCELACTSCRTTLGAAQAIIEHPFLREFLECGSTTWERWKVREINATAERAP